jgi:hypothetical protein
MVDQRRPDLDRAYCVLVDRGQISDQADPGLKLLCISQPGICELDDQSPFVAVRQHHS